MFEPLKYGLPLGMFQLLLFALQLFLNLESYTLYRWAIAALTLVLVSMVLYRKRSRESFSFRMAWFSSFNVLVASTIFFAVMLIVLIGYIIPTALQWSLKERLYVAFQEFFGVMTVGLIALTVFSWIFTRPFNRKHHGR